MWIVKLALTRPYTFVVAAILILVLGIASVATMPTDILPNIDIPVITVVYDYRGLRAQEMEQRITTFNEFIMSTVNDVKSIDSQTVRGYAIDSLSFSSGGESAVGAPLQRINGADLSACSFERFSLAIRVIRLRHLPGPAKDIGRSGHAA